MYLGSGILTGDIVYYGNGTHSAVVSENTTASSAPIAHAICISKWGSLGVFRHALGEVPPSYNTASISTWRRA